MNSLRALLLLLVVASCSLHEGYNRFIPVDADGWNTNDVIHFKPLLEDSLSAFNISLMVRHTDNYPYQNLWLTVALKQNSDVVFDTIQLILADRFGRWVGEGNGTIRTFRLPYRSNIRFEHGGTCAVSIKQAMNDPLLKGILDVGVAIEKAP